MDYGETPYDPIAAVAQLDEPNRRRLYDLVAASPEPTGRDDAAAALGMSRELAAFHLDRLVKAGLLETEFRRRGTRSGPGAGRPAKLYRRADRDLTVAFPPRRYLMAADLMAAAIDRLAGPSGEAALATVAHERGSVVGGDARRKAGSRPGRRRLATVLVEVLRGGGFEPQVDPADGTIRLCNCPYDALTGDHRALTCGMNAAWAQGIVDGLGAAATVELAPDPERCCVVFHTASGATGRPRSGGPDPVAS